MLLVIETMSPFLTMKVSPTFVWLSTYYKCFEKKKWFYKTFFCFEILAKNGANIGLLKPILVLTRPDTNDLNQELNSTINGSKLISQELIFHKLGRWQVLLKINDGSDIGFYKFDFYVK